MLTENPALAVALAFILGWVADWLVELVYWRNQRQQQERARFQAQLDAKDARIKELQKQLEEARRDAFPKAIAPPADTGTLQEELNQANARVATQALEIAALQRQLDSLRAAPRDDTPPAGDVGAFEVDSMAEEDKALRDLWAAVASSDVGAPLNTEQEAREAAAWLADEPETDSMAPPAGGDAAARQAAQRPASPADDASRDEEI